MMGKWIEALKPYKSWIALIGVMIVLSIMTEGTFLTARNLTNLSRQVSINGILAVGMTFVILIGGIDLSIGSVVALSGVVAGLLQVNYGLATWEGPMAWVGAVSSILAAIIVGVFCGIFNGWMITRYRIAPFIITLGMMVIARGIALILTQGSAIAPMGESFNWIGQGYVEPMGSAVLISGAALLVLISQMRAPQKRLSDWLAIGATLAITGGALYTFMTYRGLPIPVLVFALFAALGAMVLNKTRLGRYVLAVGGNSDAAWLSGVPIRPITMGIYVTLGALAGLSGAILAARLNGAMPTGGELFELDAIAAVVIGGTSLLGGVGTIAGTILGAFFMGALNNGMSLLDVTEFYQKVIKGVIIILAVWFDTRSDK
jgi:D-xylose transport system permease protein